MKKKVFAALIVLLALVLVFAACKKEVTVTFDTDGGLPATWSQEVNEGSEVARPTDPTKSGYTFAGWYSDEACTRAYDFGTKIYQDTTIYAKWTRNIVNYTVKFDTDGGGTISPAASLCRPSAALAATSFSSVSLSMAFTASSCAMAQRP